MENLELNAGFGILIYIAPFVNGCHEHQFVWMCFGRYQFRDMNSFANKVRNRPLPTPRMDRPHVRVLPGP